MQVVTSGAMHDACRQLRVEARVSVFTDKAEKSSPSQSGRDHVKEQPTGVLLANDVKPAREDLPRDLQRSPAPKAWDPTGFKAKEAAGQKQSISTGVSNRAGSGLHQDIENGKVDPAVGASETWCRVHRGWAEKWFRVGGKRGGKR
jgi:hypothetical protein